MHPAASTGRNRWVVGAFLALPALYLAVFYAYPIYKVIALSLRDFQPAFGYDDFVGLANYGRILGDPTSWAHILRTFVYTGLSVAASLGLGLGFAMLTVATDQHLSRSLATGLRQIVILPMIFIPAAAAVMWSFAYTEHYGWVNHILAGLGFQTYPWLISDAAFFLVILTDIWGWTPFMYLILLAGLQTLPVEPIEAARVDGATFWQTFRFIILPMLKPVIAIAVTIKALDTYRAFDYLWIMTQGGPGTSSTTLNIVTYKTAFLDLDFGRASAFGVITMIFPIAAILLLLALRPEPAGWDRAKR